MRVKLVGNEVLREVLVSSEAGAAIEKFRKLTSHELVAQSLAEWIRCTVEGYGESVEDESVQLPPHHQYLITKSILRMTSDCRVLGWAGS